MQEIRPLFVAQSRMLEIFYLTAKKLNILNRSSFIVSDMSYYYESFLRKYPDFEDYSNILKEWDIQKKAKSKKELDFNEELIKLHLNYCDIDNPNYAKFFDRRFILGKNAKFYVDYRKTFSNDFLDKYIFYSFKEAENFFDLASPNSVVTYLGAVQMDYVVNLISKKRNIKFLNIRHSRIGDRVFISDTFHDPDAEFRKTFNANNLSSESEKFAEEFIVNFHNRKNLYEGTTKAVNRPIQSIVNYKKYISYNFIKNFINKIISFYKNQYSKVDSMTINPVKSFFHFKYSNRIRSLWVKNSLKDSYLEAEKVMKGDFIFFPLHAEPEVSIFLYGRPFHNQIELIRTISMSMPINFKLIVKEHPFTIGKRKLSFYKKLLNIPGVYIVDPNKSADELIKKSKLVSIISGSSGIEAVLNNKPVITFGSSIINVLPSNLVRKVSFSNQLTKDINNLLINFKEDRSAIKKFFKTIYDRSFSLRLYDILLEKHQGQYSITNRTLITEIEILAKEIEKRIY